MKENLLKYKKIGLISVLIIVVLSSILIYNTSGFKQLNKNDNESIFVDDENSVFDEGSQNNNYKDDSSYSNNTAENKLQNKTIIVEIKGQVKNPDVYTLDENSIVNDLITLAGGVTENADLNSINRAKKLQNHEMIYIADKNEVGIEQNSMADSSGNTVVSESLVDINTAEAERLKTLNGIGDSKAKSIIEYREQNGGFKSIEEIKNVTGIGDKMFEKIKDNITV